MKGMLDYVSAMAVAVVVIVSVDSGIRYFTEAHSSLPSPVLPASSSSSDQVPQSIVQIRPKIRNMKDGDEGSVFVGWNMSAEMHIWLDPDCHISLFASNKLWRLDTGDVWVRKVGQEYRVEVGSVVVGDSPHADSVYQGLGYVRAAEVKVVDK